MENFVLYHEIYRKDGMIMYKGRKKGTITYVAVSCIEKDQRIKVTNHVRIVFELEHRNVVRFYEWYETSNHLWLVTDLCVGGSLQQMLLEDTSFPECAIRTFGAQLVRGLRYLHGRGIVYVQWHPGKIVLDGTGQLKYFDFSDAKKADEDYDELVQRFFSGLNIEARDVEDLFDYRRAGGYTAPEVLKGTVPGLAADVWGLACLLYEMLAGTPPFGGLSADELVERIVNGPIIVPQVVQGGTRGLSSRVSPELSDLLGRMFQRNVEARIDLEGVWRHRFWQGELDDLAVLVATGGAISREGVTTPLDTLPSVRPRTASQLASVPVGPGGPGGAAGPSDDNDSSSSTTTNTVDDVSFTLHLGSARPAVPTEAATAAGNAAPEEEDANATGGHSRSKRHQFQLDPHDLAVPTGGATAPLADQHKLLAIATSTTSSTVASKGNHQIEDYARMLKDGRLKFDAKLLSITPFTTVKLRGLRKPDRDKHVRQLEIAIKTGEKGPPSQRRLHLINYLAQICMSAEVSNSMLESGVALELCRQLKSSSNQELMVRICQALAVIFHHSSCSGSYGEMLVIIGDVLRDQFRCSRVKIAALAALGEGLVKLSEVVDDSSMEPPAFGLYVTLINRCLHRTEEVSTNLVATRTIEAISSEVGSVLARQVANPDTMQQLYTAFKHASIDPLKISAITAMCRLTRLDSALFCGLLDKTGTTGLLENLHVGLLGVQEAVLEMLAVIMVLQSTVPAVRKLAQELAFIKAVMRLLETPAALVRAKALLLVLLLCRSDLGLLKIAAEHRLVLYLEREFKRTNGPSQQQDMPDAMEQCLAMFTSFLATFAVPTILENCCSALHAVQGRRHPSSLQTKALRSCLPLLECATSLTSSPSLRQLILSSSFCALLAQLISHASRVDSGHTNLGPDTAPQFLTHVLGLAEAAVCHCGSGSDTSEAVLLLDHLLEPLASFTGATANADIRIIGLKLCGDIVTVLVQSDMFESNLVNMTYVSTAVEKSLLPQMQQFMTDPDPSAVYLLRLLRNYLQISTEQCISVMKQHAFPQLLVQTILNHQQRIMAAVLLESLLLISAIGQTSMELLRDFVLDVDLVPILCDTLMEISDVYHKDEMSLRTPKTSELFLAGMESMYCLAKLISDVVRRALQSKKSQENEEATARLTTEAEELLGAGKPLTEMVDLLIYSISNSDPDTEVVESSIKLLNQVVSLYGGQQIYHGLNEINVKCLCHAVIASTTKQRRTLLRILKRLLASGQLPSPAISTIVRDVITGPAFSTGLLDGDSVCTGLAEEIKRYLDK